MTSSVHLFIGGPADGQWLDVSDDVGVRYAYLILPPMPPAPMALTMKLGETKTDNYAMYRRMPWEVDGARREIFVTDSMTNAAVLDRLLSGYRRPR